MPIRPFTLNGWLWAIWYIYWMAAAFFAARSRHLEKLLSRSQYMFLLIVGFILIFRGRTYCLIVGPLYDSPALEWLATTATAAGLLLSIWARRHLAEYWSAGVTLKEAHLLIRTGPYRLCRHPIYAGMTLAAAGSAATVSTGDALIGFLLIVAGLLLKVIREEKLLLAQFGDEYRKYQQEVGLLWPRVFK